MILLCKLGIHKLGSWGYGFGMFEIFCARCQKRIKTYEVGRLVGKVEDSP